VRPPQRAALAAAAAVLDMQTPSPGTSRTCRVPGEQRGHCGVQHAGSGKLVAFRRGQVRRPEQAAADRIADDGVREIGASAAGGHRRSRRCQQFRRRPGHQFGGRVEHAVSPSVGYPGVPRVHSVRIHQDNLAWPGAHSDALMVELLDASVDEGDHVGLVRVPAVPLPDETRPQEIHPGQARVLPVPRHLLAHAADVTSRLPHGDSLPWHPGPGGTAGAGF
jgi:hypothetical protein